MHISLHIIFHLLKKTKKYPQEILLFSLNLIFHFLIYCSRKCLSHIVIEFSQISKWLVTILIWLFILNANMLGPSLLRTLIFLMKLFVICVVNWTKELSKKQSCRAFVCCSGQIYQQRKCVSILNDLLTFIYQLWIIWRNSVIFLEKLLVVVLKKKLR